MKIINCIILVLTIIQLTIPNLAVSEDSFYEPPIRNKVLSASSTKEEIRQKIVAIYGERMAKIVKCESGYNLYKHNYKDPNGGSYGLFQINAPWISTAKKMGLDIMKQKIILSLQDIS